MAQTLSDNLQCQAPKVLDNRSGRFESGVWRPYNDLAEFNSAQPLLARPETLIFWVRSTTNVDRADLYTLDKNKAPYLVSPEVDLSNYYTKAEINAFNLAFQNSLDDVDEQVQELNEDLINETQYRIDGDTDNALAISNEVSRATNSENSLLNLINDKASYSDVYSPIYLSYDDIFENIYTNIDLANQNDVTIIYESPVGLRFDSLSFNALGEAVFPFAVEVGFEGFIFGTFIIRDNFYVDGIGTLSHAFLTKDGDVMGYITSEGKWFIFGETESIQTQLSQLKSDVSKYNSNNNGTDAIYSITDKDGKAVTSVDKNGGLLLAESETPIQNLVPSKSIFNAIRNEKLGNELQAKYWYDRAENELQIPIKMFKLIAPDGLDGSIQRIPVITTVSEGRLLCMWQQIRKPVGSDGTGTRIVKCFVDYDLYDRRIDVGDISIFDEMPGFTDRLGAVMHPHLITLPSGKIICVYNINDNPDGIVTNRILNIYMRSSIDGGVTWSNKIKIADAPPIPPGETQTIIATGSTGDFIRFESGTYAGRIVFPIWRYPLGASLGSMYSDDDGVTWVIGNSFSTPGFTGNECGIAIQSNGNLIMNIRTEAGTNPVFPQELYAISSNGGESWVYMGAKNDWRTPNCSKSTVQASLSASEGFQKVLWSGIDGANNNQRNHLVLRVSHDDGLSWQTQYEPIPALMAAGYSNIKMISPNLFTCVWENGFNTTNSVYIYIANMAEVYTKGLNVYQ